MLGNVRYLPLNMADSKIGSSNFLINLAIQSKLSTLFSVFIDVVNQNIGYSWLSVVE